MSTAPLNAPATIPEPPDASEPQASIPIWRSFVLLALGLTTAFIIGRGASLNTSSEAGTIPELPTVVAGYIGRSEPVSEAEKEMLPLDTVFAKKIYQSPIGEELSAQIVLSGGEKRSIHRPEICLPGQGWTIRSGTPIPVQLANGRTMKAMHLMLARPVQLAPNDTRTLNSHFVYWFVGRDRITPSNTERVLLTSWDRVMHNTNHRWAYIIVSSLVLEGFKPGAKTSDESLKMVTDFISDLAPYIHQPRVLESLSPAQE